jgi:hypothetical protein
MAEFAAALPAPSGGTIVAPMHGKGVDKAELAVSKGVLLAEAHAKGVRSAQEWIGTRPDMRMIKNGLVVVQGKFQPPTFGHEMMVTFAHGFQEGAAAETGNSWQIRYAIFPVSDSSLMTQVAKKGKVETLLGAEARIHAWQPSRKAGGARGKRGTDDAGLEECQALCRRFFREACDPEPGHIVLIVGVDAAAPEFTATFIVQNAAAKKAADDASHLFEKKYAAAKERGRNPPSINSCYSVLPYGEDRPDEIGSDEALAQAKAAMASGKPVAISATLARAAAVAHAAGDAAAGQVLEVTRPVSDAASELHDRYLSWYPTINKDLAEHPGVCPFCHKAFKMSKSEIVKKACQEHMGKCPKAPHGGGARTRRGQGQKSKGRRITRRRRLTNRHVLKQSHRRRSFATRRRR